MSFKVVLADRVQRQIVSCHLPDAVLVEVYLRLKEKLPKNPAAQLVRSTELFDGLIYPFEFVDPANRMSLYRFFFHVTYGQDEESLHVLNMTMLHSQGM